MDMTKAFQIDMAIKSVRGNRLGGWASFRSVDRGEELVLPSAFEKWLPTFMAHPVMLLGHQMNSSLELPIGKFTKAVIKEDGLEVEGRLLKAHPKYAAVSKAVADGLMAWSIGFIPKVTREPNEDDVKAYGTSVKVIVEELELVEISLVTVGMNRDTLAALKALTLQSRKVDLSSLDFLKELADIKKVRDATQDAVEKVKATQEDAKPNVEAIAEGANVFVTLLNENIAAIVGLLEAGDEEAEGDEDEGGDEGGEGGDEPAAGDEEGNSVLGLINEINSQTDALSADLETEDN